MNIDAKQLGDEIAEAAIDGIDEERLVRLIVETAAEVLVEAVTQAVVAQVVKQLK